MSILSIIFISLIVFAIIWYFFIKPKSSSSPDIVKVSVNNPTPQPIFINQQPPMFQPQVPQQPIYQIPQQPQQPIYQMPVPY